MLDACQEALARRVAADRQWWPIIAGVEVNLRPAAALLWRPGHAGGDAVFLHRPRAGGVEEARHGYFPVFRFMPQDVARPPARWLIVHAEKLIVRASKFVCRPRCSLRRRCSTSRRSGDATACAARGRRILSANP